MRFYGLDLADQLATAGCRRLWVLVQGLPSNAAVWREDRWTHQDEMLATLVELTDAWGLAVFTAVGGKLRGKHTPVRVQRPGAVQQDTQQSSAPAAANKTVTTDPLEIARFFKTHH